MARRIKLRREFQINAVPCRIFSQGMGLLLPVRHIGLQGFICRIGFFQTFGRQHFNALRQQHGCLALHHDLVLKVFNGFHFFAELSFQAGQRFARQRRTSFGGIALPCHGIGNVQAAGRQHGVGALSPFSRQHILSLRAFEFVQLFTQNFGGTLVACRKFFVDVLQIFLRGLSQQPITQFGSTFARCLSGKGTSGEGIKCLHIGGLGGGMGHSQNTKR